MRIQYQDENADPIGEREMDDDELVIDPVIQARGGMAAFDSEPKMPHIDSVDLIAFDDPLDAGIYRMDIGVEAPEFPEETAWFGFNLMVELLDRDFEDYKTAIAPIAASAIADDAWQWLNIRKPSFFISFNLNPEVTVRELHKTLQNIESLIGARVTQVQTLSTNVRSARKPDDSRWRKKVFICHSSRDHAFARKLADSLNRESVQVWIDEDEILVGHDFTSKMEEGLTTADFVVIVLSPNFVKYGPWAQKEYREALSREVVENRVRLLPALKKDCDVPPLLRTRHYADFRKSFDQGLKRLVNSIRRHDVRHPDS
jgi:TIR domain-containing protein